MSDELAPGQLDIDGQTVEPDQEPTEPAPVEPDTPPKRKRPTTRQGRKAASDRAKAKAAAAGRDAAPRKQTSSRKSPLRTRLEGAIDGVGTAVTIAGAITGSEPLKADGQVIGMHGANLAEALDKIAQNDPRVKDALEKLLQAGAYSGLFMAVAPIALGIMGNHGMIPAGLGAVMGAPAQSPDPAATGIPDDAFTPQT